MAYPSDDIIRKEWFKDNKIIRWWHSRSYLPGVEMTEVCVWANPNSRINSVTYVRYGNVLHVHGDLGAATYIWPQAVDLQWISKCDIGYFASKCVASENGPGHKIYDAIELEEFIERYKSGLEHEETAAELDKALESLEASDAIHAGEFEWRAWLQEHGNAVFGSNFYEDECLLGKVISIRCRAHLIGLKMAVEQAFPSSNR